MSCIETYEEHIMYVQRLLQDIGVGCSPERLTARVEYFSGNDI